jgi:hypothetical protein
MGDIDYRCGPVADADTLPDYWVGNDRKRITNAVTVGN